MPPLTLPTLRIYRVESMSQYEQSLFADRAQAVKAGFAQARTRGVPRSASLDGLPLAIELAAARAKLLSPQALLVRLEQRFELLTGGPRDLPERQQTLRATIDWSYKLLGPEEQTLFARLAVFVGGCTLEAAEKVCGGAGILTGLATLIDNSLLRQDEQPDGEPRCTMLESIRAYALERLEASGEADEIRQRQSEYFLSLANRIEEDVRTKPDVDWFALEREHDNFRAALTWLVAGDETESVVQLTFELHRFWEVRGLLAESRRWCDFGLTVAPRLPPALEARVWLHDAALGWRMGEYSHARTSAARALGLFWSGR